MKKEFLKRLLEAVSPSGQEDEAINVWKEELEGEGILLRAYEDKIKNCAYSLGSGPCKILLSGHIDEVAARVSLISDSGLLCVHYAGNGIDNRSLPGQRVIVLTDSGEKINGAVIKQPMHLDKDSDWPNGYSDFSKIRVDIGCEDKESVEKLGIHPGCPVIYSSPVSIDWGENRICSPGLDDKVAVFIVAEVMKRLNKPFLSWDDKYTVIGLAATQEETGLRGATIAARNISPDISIDIDVDWATDDDLSGPKEKIGDIKLGEGVIISYGADKSTRLNMILTKIARESDIKFQYASSGPGGTNTDAIQLNSSNCETTHLAIPNRSMHSPVEICDWRDIEAAINLLVKVIENELL